MIELPARTVEIEAAPSLVFEVIAAGGRTIEERSPTERIVAFRSQVSGRTIETVEHVTLYPPERIEYIWLEGPLPAVRESIAVAPAAHGSSRIRYEGRFQPAGNLIQRLAARVVVRRAFDRAVRAHLAEVKRLAEERAARSHVHPRPERTEG